MKKMIIGMIAVGAFVTSQFINLTGKPIPTSIKKVKRSADFFAKNIIPQAHAGAPENNLRDVVKILYYTVGGYPSIQQKEDLYWSLTGQHAPNPNDIGGMMGLASDYSAMIESVLASNGIRSCASIPSSGTYIGVIDGTPISLVLAASSKVKPANYPSAGQNYEKRIQMSVSGNPEMYFEFDCSRKSGWFLHSENGSNRKMEVYFDAEDVAATRIEFFMDYTDGTADEYTYARLITNANNIFDLDVIQGKQLGVGDYMGQRFIAQGDWATKVMKVMGFQVTNKATMAAVASHVVGGGANVKDADSTDATLAESFCVDSNEVTTDKGDVTGCGGLTLNSRAGEKPAIDSSGTGAITVQWVARQDANGLKTKMSSF